MGYEFLKALKIFVIAFCVMALYSPVKVLTFRRNQFHNHGKIFAVPKRRLSCCLRGTNFPVVFFVFTYLVCFNVHLLQLQIAAVSVE